MKKGFLKFILSRIGICVIIAGSTLMVMVPFSTPGLAGMEVRW